MFTAPQSPWLVSFDGSFRHTDAATAPPVDAPGKKASKLALKERVRALDRLQRMFYAHDRRALLLVFQGMDAAGKGRVTAMETA